MNLHTSYLLILCLIHQFKEVNGQRDDISSFIRDPYLANHISSNDAENQEENDANTDVYMNNMYMNHGFTHKINTEERFKKLYSKMNQITVDHAWNIRNIECLNLNDFYYLLFRICNGSRICSELYYFEDTDDFTRSHSVHKKYSESGNGMNGFHIRVENMNIKKFIYQLSLVQLYPIRNENNPTHHSSSSSSINKQKKDNTSHHEEKNESIHYLRNVMMNEILTNDRLFILEENWLSSWLPLYIITLNTTRNISCSRTFDIENRSNREFIVDTLYLLQTYRLFVTNEHFCYDFNEELKLDDNNQFHCKCKDGKQCNSDTNFRQIIIILMFSLIALLLLWTFCYILSHISIIRQLSEINKQNKLKLQQHPQSTLPSTTTTPTPTSPTIPTVLTDNPNTSSLSSPSHISYGFV